MTISKVHSTPTSPLTDNWYIAQQTNIITKHTPSTGSRATATGYGTTHYGALVACMRDINKINSL